MGLDRDRSVLVVKALLLRVLPIRSMVVLSDKSWFPTDETDATSGGGDGADCIARISCLS